MSLSDTLPQLRSYYQPVCFSDGHLVYGYEAFISDYTTGKNATELYELAAKNNQTQLLEKIAFSKICRDYSRSKFGGKLFINMFCESLTTGNLQPESILNILKKTDISPNCIVIELTEYAPIKNIDLLLSAIETLKEQGIQLSLDGFGFGYSNIGRLLELSPNHVKLDARFYVNQSDDRRLAVLATLVQLCALLDVCVIAKNVETAEIANAIRSKIGIGLFQGDFFGYPVGVNNEKSKFATRYAFAFSENTTPALSSHFCQQGQ